MTIQSYTLTHNTSVFKDKDEKRMNFKPERKECRFKVINISFDMDTFGNIRQMFVTLISLVCQ